MDIHASGSYATTRRLSVTGVDIAMLRAKAIIRKYRIDRDATFWTMCDKLITKTLETVLPTLTEAGYRIRIVTEPLPGFDNLDFMTRKSRPWINGPGNTMIVQVRAGMIVDFFGIE